ncbi:ACT domain-containing protein, partial [Pseudomonadales bacterium]|nr:ACT domain-containing protein [Pseudomonadales bacterium]
MKHSYRLVIHCPDRVGIVATVSQFIADNGGSLLEASYHADPATQRFFMRTEIEVSSLSIDLPEFESRFKPVADTFNMTW